MDLKEVIAVTQLNFETRKDFPVVMFCDNCRQFDATRVERKFEGRNTPANG